GSKYKASASTNEAYCPTLKGAVKSALDADIESVLEIVIDGLTAPAVATAMRAGLAAIVKLGPKRGALRVGAGNYGGKLGPHHFHLKNLLPLNRLCRAWQPSRNSGSVHHPWVP